MNSDKLAENLTALAPAILSTMIAVEQSAHQLPGATKAQMVINAVLAGSQELGAQQVSPKVTAVATLVTIFAGILNSLHVFNHGAAPNSAAIAAAKGPQLSTTT